MGHGTPHRLCVGARATVALCLLALAVARPVAAGNGRVAVLFPVDGITLDGDLSDWPAKAERYPVELAETGVPPTGAEDLTAHFSAVFSPDGRVLYVAIEVADESSVLDGPASPWFNSRDGCEIYLRLERDARLRVFPTAAFQFVQWGDQTHHFSTIPELRGVPGVPRSLDRPRLEGSYEVAALHEPGRHVYEWRIDVDRITHGKRRLEPQRQIGLDVVVNDLDADGSFSWMAWGRGTEKLYDPDRMGEGLVVGPGEGLTAVVDRATAVSEASFQRTIDRTRERTAYQMFFTGALLAVTFIHLLLFLFYRQIRTNLFYALFTGVSGGLFYYGFDLFQYRMPTYMGPTSNNFIPALVVTESLVLVGVLGLLFLYSLFYPRLPRRFWVLLVLLGGAGLSVYEAVGNPGELHPGSFLMPVALVGLALLVTVVEFLHVVLRAIRRRQEGAWMMGVGFLAFGGAGIYGTTQLMNLGPIDNALLFAVLLPLASMSVYLARSVARDRRTLEIQNRALELANDRIRQQSQQVQEANRLKSDFLARMSHDLRTPLNAIIGYTRILLRRTKDNLEERQYQNLQNISISADNLLALINDILDLSRIEAGRTEMQVDDVDLSQLASQCAAAVESLVPDGVELRRELEPVAPVRTDADRVRRVLMNLLGNALKYTEAGHIALSLKSVGEPGAEAVELAVTDTGTGIPAGDLPHIFDEFRQVDRRDKKREGSGLGLAIARRSVEMLGGSIRAESEEGVGSTFTVRLGHAPMAGSNPPPAADAPTAVPEPEPSDA